MRAETLKIFNIENRMFWSIIYIEYFSWADWDFFNSLYIQNFITMHNTFEVLHLSLSMRTYTYTGCLLQSNQYHSLLFNTHVPVYIRHTVDIWSNSENDSAIWMIANFEISSPLWEQQKFMRLIPFQAQYKYYAVSSFYISTVKMIQYS